MKLLSLSLSFFLLFTAVTVYAQPDYTQYHLGIIAAEEEIFLQGKPAAGLELFKKTFDKYEFAYVDDCIEAFQLALHFNQQDYAMRFIKKALDNGFELKFLDRLSPACPCTYYKDYATKVSVHHSFMAKHHTSLENYSKEVYPKYLARINKELLNELLKRHVKEQMYKNYIPGLAVEANNRESIGKQKLAFSAVYDENMRFIDSLAQQNIFLGERNLGIYTDKLMASLHLPIKDVKSYTKHMLEINRVSTETKVPVTSEDEYFDHGALYSIWSHNYESSHHRVTKYRNAAIRQGYLHPREYASLKYLKVNTPKAFISEEENVYLVPNNQSPQDSRKELNNRRKEMLLPSYELDSAKHAFAHQNRLHLYFGKFSGTR